MYKISDNILSPLGVTTEENLRAVLDGRSELIRHEHMWGMPEPFCASMFTGGRSESMQYSGCSRMESFAIRSIYAALEGASFEYKGVDVVLILSSAKGNVELLREGDDEANCYRLGASARRIADVLGFVNEPVVVSNACISGVSALHLARLLLDSGRFRYAVVCGVDVQSAFVVSGFQSLKATSASPCRPFDICRSGLNLGEAAVTMVLAGDDVVAGEGSGLWHIGRTSVHNDAFHLTSPSKNADGAYAALSDVLDGIGTDELGFVNLHGTATMFNDQMEAVALRRVGLASLPANGLKGYYGHTMGAAGILETVLSMAAADDGLLPATLGFAELGVSVPLNITSVARQVDKPAFVKMISGFGGVNAALFASKGKWRGRRAAGSFVKMSKASAGKKLKVEHTVRIEPGKVLVDDRLMALPDEDTHSFLTAIYRKYVGDYPKFYKMDLLAKLGFLASELLLQAEGGERFSVRSDRAVLLFNRLGSFHADKAYLKTISNPDNYFPSPSLFIYTLPNIVTGEIAIRNHYQGETSFYILAERDEPLMEQIVGATLEEPQIQSVIYGWVEAEDEMHFCVDIKLVRLGQ